MADVFWQTNKLRTWLFNGSLFFLHRWSTLYYASGLPCMASLPCGNWYWTNTLLALPAQTHRQASHPPVRFPFLLSEESEGTRGSKSLNNPILFDLSLMLYRACFWPPSTHAHTLTHTLLFHAQLPESSQNSNTNTFKSLRQHAPFIFLEVLSQTSSPFKLLDVPVSLLLTPLPLRNQKTAALHRDRHGDRQRLQTEAWMKASRSFHCSHLCCFFRSASGRTEDQRVDP